MEMGERGKRKTLTGVISSDKMDKTVIVTVERRTQHPVYSKFIKRRKKYAALDEDNRCRTGDVVEIISCRPFSKMKKWAVTGIVKQAQPAAASE